jgi:hypothetical protein
MNPFQPRSDGLRSAALRNLKQTASALFHAEEGDAVMVNELACSEPGCPPVETVVALLRAGHPPRQLKVHKPLLEVTEDDLRHALRGEHEAH